MTERPVPRRPLNHEPPLSIRAREMGPRASEMMLKLNLMGRAVEGVVSMDKWLLVLAAEIVLAAIIIANLPALLRLHC